MGGSIYAPDGSVKTSFKRFSEWDGDTDFDLHPYGWPHGDYRVVFKDLTTVKVGEVTFSVVSSPGRHHYHDYDDRYDDWYDD